MISIQGKEDTCPIIPYCRKELKDIWRRLPESFLG